MTTWIMLLFFSLMSSASLMSMSRPWARIARIAAAARRSVAIGSPATFLAYADYTDNSYQFNHHHLAEEEILYRKVAVLAYDKASGLIATDVVIREMGAARKDTEQKIDRAIIQAIAQKIERTPGEVALRVHGENIDLSLKSLRNASVDSNAFHIASLFLLNARCSPQLIDIQSSSYKNGLERSGILLSPGMTEEQLADGIEGLYHKLRDFKSSSAFTQLYNTERMPIEAFVTEYEERGKDVVAMLRKVVPGKTGVLWYRGPAQPRNWGTSLPEYTTWCTK